MNIYQQSIYRKWTNRADRSTLAADLAAHLESIKKYPNLYHAISLGWSAQRHQWGWSPLIMQLLECENRIERCENKDILYVEEVTSLLPGHYVTRTTYSYLRKLGDTFPRRRRVRILDRHSLSRCRTGYCPWKKSFRNSGTSLPAARYWGPSGSVSCLPTTSVLSQHFFVAEVIDTMVYPLTHISLSLFEISWKCEVNTMWDIYYWSWQNNICTTRASSEPNRMCKESGILSLQVFTCNYSRLPFGIWNHLRFNGPLTREGPWCLSYGWALWAPVLRFQKREEC